MTSIQDIHNTTDAALGIAGVFTGIGRNLIDSQFASILINCFADQDGSLDVQFSSDGTTFNSFRVYQVKANKKRKVALDVEDLFYRLVYTNGSLAQSTFSLEAFLLVNQSSVQHNSEAHYSYHNSTIVPLDIAEVFTGSADDCSEFSSVSVGVYADEAGSLDVQFSEDNSNWYFTNTTAVSASTAMHYNVECQARYCRVVYTNGGVAQSIFVLSTNFKKSHLMDDPIEVTDGGNSLTVDSAQLPASLGQDVMANSLPVVVASDQSKLGVNLNDGTGTSIASTTNSLHVLLQNSSVAVNDNSGSLTVDNGGTFAVQVNQIPTAGSEGNAWNAATVAADDNSNSVDMQYCSKITIFGNSDQSDEILIQVSQDNSTWYNSGLSIFPASMDFYTSIIDVGLRYVRLRLVTGATTATITASIVGKM